MGGEREGRLRAAGPDHRWVSFATNIEREEEEDGRREYPMFYVTSSLRASPSFVLDSRPPFVLSPTSPPPDTHSLPSPPPTDEVLVKLAQLTLICVYGEGDGGRELFSLFSTHPLALSLSMQRVGFITLTIDYVWAGGGVLRGGWDGGGEWLLINLSLYRSQVQSCLPPRCEINAFGRGEWAVCGQTTSVSIFAVNFSGRACFLLPSFLPVSLSSPSASESPFFEILYLTFPFSQTPNLLTPLPPSRHPQSRFTKSSVQPNLINSCFG